MKKRLILPLALSAALALGGAAVAEAGYDFDGKVVCIRPETVTATIGGTVFSVPAQAGQLVEAGDALAELSTTKIYAPADGTVTGVFCAPGDTVSDVTDRYEALMYIEPDSKYTLKASTDNSYNASANKYIHVGEKLYLSCTDGNHTGTGFVTQAEGTDFTVEVTEGGFYIGETVSAYRNSSRNSKSRVGRGTIARMENVAVTVTTSSDNDKEKTKAAVAAVHVQNGDAVQAGDLLIETLTGEYDARYCTGSTLKSDKSGILASLNVSPGGAVSKGDVIATIYPRENLQVEVDVNEADLAHLSVGTPVLISFNWNEDSEEAALYSGTVSRVLYTTVDSGGKEGESSDAAFAAYIDFEADAPIRLGMTATVRTGSDEEEAEEEPEEEPENEETDAPDNPEGGMKDEANSDSDADTRPDRGRGNGRNR